MNPKTLRKAILAALLLVAASFAATTAPTTEAASGSNCIYYSDASHTTVVGKFGKDCCNNVIAWGTKTSFSECSSACLVCTPPPR